MQNRANVGVVKGNRPKGRKDTNMDTVFELTQAERTDAEQRVKEVSDGLYTYWTPFGDKMYMTASSQEEAYCGYIRSLRTMGYVVR